MMQRPWFKAKPFTSLKVEEYESLSSRKVIQSVNVEDTSTIQSLVDRIEKIDPNGDMMVSWGPDAAYMLLTFENERESDVIQIIQQKFKTPSTGFHDRNNEQEASLYKDIRALFKN